MIYEIEGEYVISSGRVWLPGVYATRRAANYAFRFSDEELSSISGTVTFEQLQELRKRRKSASLESGD